jgi:hypothetical protein
MSNLSRRTDLYAAILPVTPRIIFFPANILEISKKMAEQSAFKNNYNSIII